MTKEIRFVVQMIRNNFMVDCHYDIESINWKSVIDILEEHRIFINSYNVLKCNVPNDYSNEVTKQYNNHRNLIDNNIKHLVAFTREAKNKHVRFVLVKGLGLGKQIYEDFYSRQANDLDILVAEDDMIRGHHVLKKLGYKQPNIIDFKTLEYSELDYPIMRLRHTNHFFEYYTLDRSDWCKIELHKKLYYISSQFIDDFLWNVSQIEVGTEKINILNIQYSFILLIANAFENSEALYSIQGNCKIREYIDLYNFLSRYSMVLHWDEINKIIKQYGLLVVVERVMDNLAELYDDPSLLKYKILIMKDERDNRKTIWDLHMSFIDRMFDSKTRKETIRNLQKCKAFEKSKARYRIYKNYDLKNMQKLETVHNVIINYQITYDESKLILFVLVDKKIIIDIKDYLFQLIVYNDNINSPYLYSLLEITFEDEAVAHVINTPILRDSNVLRKKDRGIKKECIYKEKENSALLKTEIKFEEMELTQGKNSCNFAISFNWFKYMQPLTYHHMEPDADSLYASNIVEFA